MLILPYESNTGKISIWLQLLFYCKGNCHTKLGEGFECCLQCLVYIPFLLASTQFLLLNIFHCLKKWLSSCKAALVTAARRNVWGNNVGEKGCYWELAVASRVLVSEFLFACLSLSAMFLCIRSLPLGLASSSQSSFLSGDQRSSSSSPFWHELRTGPLWGPLWAV